MNRVRLLTAGLLAAAIGSVGLLVPSPAQTAATYKLNFGTVAPAGTPWAAQLQQIKERIGKESEGQIQVNVFLGGTLGGEVEQVQELVEGGAGGRLQGGGFSTAAVAQGANVPALQLPELPFLFDSDAEADYVLDNVLFEPIKKKLKRRGLVLAMWSINGWRSFYTKQKAVLTIADLAEHKMRVQESEVHKAMYRALGVQALPLPTPEVLDALSRGTVDGFDNTTLFGQASGWFEPTRHYTLTRHIFQPAAIIYSKDWMESLPENLQTIVIGDRRQEQKFGRDAVRGMEGELLALFPELGVEVHEVSADQRKVFADKTRGVHEEFREVVGSDLLDEVYKAIKAFRSK